MDDLISRQTVIDAIVAWAKDHNETPDGDDCIMIIGDLPSAQRWISISERYPDKEGSYLVAGKWGG